ncbi:uncharacterized protein MYCFIDRAFT_173056 [Pseudocercospora fijiensis CIRAD86]|uniref:Uncharacterized protein n=1 Tax=Pseudocercospora fijiensis (strain CIRAD86) TaxID=383855 RepID=M2Z2D2_PSEFD|nr:uncharacterized protein MYCFIDRAFT_173056 [Pseudocercospora fijiensis CIRAD86]EME83995.1 hypothetical protein MYCFIDRAFT_173056 [Pseudocercospora fijiensis CIRAD86]
MKLGTAYYPEARAAARTPRLASDCQHNLKTFQLLRPTSVVDIGYADAGLQDRPSPREDTTHVHNKPHSAVFAICERERETRTMYLYITISEEQHNTCIYDNNPRPLLLRVATRENDPFYFTDALCIAG